MTDIDTVSIPDYLREVYQLGVYLTVTAITAGLLPIMWGSGTGSEVMRRIAAPMVGGMISVTLLSLIVIPALYALAKGREIRHFNDVKH